MTNINSRQWGFTLVELMIALVISSLLILATTRLFLSNSQTLRTQLALTEVNDNGQYALNRIARDIRMLGFRDQNFLGAPTGNALDATDGETDTLSVTYEHTVDCNRNPANASGQVTNVFAVVDGDLMCNGELFSQSIAGFQVRFGEDLDNDDVANRYVDPSAATLNRERVVSVQLQVTAVSSATGGAAGLGNQEITVCEPEDPSNQGAPPDCHNEAQRLRRDYSITIAVRNRI